MSSDIKISLQPYLAPPNLFGKGSVKAKRRLGIANRKESLETTSLKGAFKKYFTFPEKISFSLNRTVQTPSWTYGNRYLSHDPLFSVEIPLVTEELPAIPKRRSDPFKLRQKFGLLSYLRGTLKEKQDGKIVLLLPPVVKKILNPIFARYPQIRSMQVGHLIEVPVILPHEREMNIIREFRENGETVYIAIEDLFSLITDRYPPFSEIWYLSITSYALEDLRARYGLSTRPHGRSFTALIAGKAGKPAQKTPVEHYISPVCTPA